MDERIEALLRTLERNGFHTRYAPDAESARSQVLELIPKACSIGIGDSASIRQLGILDEMAREGRVMVNPVAPIIVEQINSGACDAKQHRRLQALSLQCDYYLTSVNALTETGALISTDAAGNRVAGSFFGPEHVVLVVGSNKIVENIEAGIARIRNCCAPMHAKTKQRRTPCAVTGKCADCNSPERLCRVTGIIERKPSKTDITVVLVDQDLGLGWENSWDQDRVQEISDRYVQATGVRRPSWVQR